MNKKRYYVKLEMTAEDFEACVKTGDDGITRLYPNNRYSFVVRDSEAFTPSGYQDPAFREPTKDDEFAKHKETPIDRMSYQQKRDHLWI